MFKLPAEREAAFRFIESEAIEAAALISAICAATLARAGGAEFAYVPVDKVTLSLPGTLSGSDFGMVGTSERPSRGVQVLGALAVTPDGTPQGLVAQTYWTRRLKTKETSQERRRRPVEDKETQRWLDVLASASANFAAHAPSTRPWFQIDREGDASPILRWAIEHDQWLTVRAAWDRRVASDDQQRQYLWETAEQLPSLGRYAVEVTSQPGRSARRAVMEVRATAATLSLPRPGSRNNAGRQPAPIYVVYAREVSAPEGEEPLEWMLLTTRPVDGFAQACEVLFGYTQRWRIEQFHKLWKTGACRVEDSQLRNYDHFVRWAILLASVATRLLRMSYLARNRADQPASIEFSGLEIRAVLLLLKPKRVPERLTVAHLVHWIAQLGGYTSPKSSGGPPGAIVLGRGFERVALAADAIAALEQT